MDPILAALFIAWWILHLVKEAPYAIRGKTSPRMQLKLDASKRKAAAAGGAATKPRSAFRSFWANLWDDAWRDADRVRKDRRDRATRGELFRQKLWAKCKEGGRPLLGFLLDALLNAFAAIGKRRGEKPEASTDPYDPPEIEDDPFDDTDPPIASVTDINTKKKEPEVSEDTSTAPDAASGETTSLARAREYGVKMAAEMTGALAQVEGCSTTLKGLLEQCQRVVNSSEVSLSYLSSAGVKGPAISALKTAYEQMSQVVTALQEAEPKVTGCIDPVSSTQRAFEAAVAEFDRQHVLTDAAAAVGDAKADETKFYDQQ